MCFALRNHLSAIAFTAAVAATSAQPVFADSAFVTQAPKGSSFGRTLVSFPMNAPAPSAPHGGVQPTP